MLLTILALAPAQAGVIHKWIDDKGVTHYSDAPPAAASAPVTTILLPDSDPDDETSNYYSIANQWRRLHRERLELERVRLEQAKLRASQQPAQPTVIIIDDDDDDDGYAVVYQRHHHRHKRHLRRAAQEKPKNIPRNWLAKRQRGGLYTPRLKATFY